MLCRIEILCCIVQSYFWQGITRIFDIDATLARNMLDFLFQNIFDEIKRLARVILFELETISDFVLSMISFFNIYLRLLIIQFYHESLIKKRTFLSRIIKQRLWLAWSSYHGFVIELQLSRLVLFCSRSMIVTNILNVYKDLIYSLFYQKLVRFKKCFIIVA